MTTVEKEFNAGAQRRRDAAIPENVLSGQIKSAAIEVHKVLGGPGLLESIYEGALFQELQLQGIQVRRQIRLPVTYKGIKMHEPMRLDLLVGEKVIVEVKAVEQNSALHKAQLLTYLRLTNLKLGLVLNFGQETLLDGLTRVVNGL
jgi:GxxExxY protein